MNAPWLSFVFCIAYDWRLALRSIASIWNIADEVLVAWDARGRTWSGDLYRPLDVDVFFDELEASIGEDFGDNRDRLRVFAGDFYREGVPRQTLQIQERVALTSLCKPGGWIFTLDADEELLNPAEVRAWCEQHPPRPGEGLNCLMTSVYKVIGETALIYDQPQRQFPIAQSEPGAFIDGVTRAQSWQLCPARLLHWHLGRDESELRIKLRALSPCGHTPEGILASWRATTLENYFEHTHGATCYSDSDTLRAVPMAMLRAMAEGGAL